MTIDNLKDTIQNFWKIEEITKISVMSREDLLAEKMFEKTQTIFSIGT